MFDRFTDRAKKVMSFSRQAADKLKHDYIDTEHIILGLVREGTGAGVAVLKNMGGNLEEIRRKVEETAVAGSGAGTMGQIPFTPSAKTVLEMSMEEAHSLGHNYIGTEHLLLGLIREDKGIAAHVLTSLDVTLELAREDVMVFLAGRDEPDAPASEKKAGGGRTTRRLVWTHWYAKGRKQAEGCYKKGKREGEWTFWNEDGSIDRERSGFYENGKLVDG